jgi:hypothetical protein
MNDRRVYAFVFGMPLALLAAVAGFMALELQPILLMQILDWATSAGRSSDPGESQGRFYIVIIATVAFFPLAGGAGIAVGIIVFRMVYNLLVHGKFAIAKPSVVAVQMGASPMS